MKNNTGQVKGLIVQAINNMPSDFALSEARTYLNWALSSLEKVENKRVRRMKMNENIAKIQGRANEAAQISQPTAQENQQMSVEQLSAAMHNIDNMIADEKKKLENMKVKPATQSATDVLKDELDQFKADGPTLLRD